MISASPRKSGRFLKVSALLVFLCFTAFYLYPIPPIPALIKTHIIRPEDTTFEAKNNNGLSSSEASALCASHKMSPFLYQKRKVYDLFMLNTELDWLEIRLHTLSKQVDYFVILESAQTFTGLPKKTFYQENASKFAKFSSQIIHHILVPPTEGELGYMANDSIPLVQGTPEYEAQSWALERFQRNAMLTQILPFLPPTSAPDEDDVILVSDIDEIPRPASIQLLRSCKFGRITTLRSRFYYYSFQWLHRGTEWDHPQATTYHGPSHTILPDTLRYANRYSQRYVDSTLSYIPRKEWMDIWNAAWHCSSCFATIKEMNKKMESFSHTNLNAKRFRGRDWIVSHVRHGKDLWERWFQYYVRVDDNHDVPPWLSENQAKFGYMLDRDGENAGFVDL